MSDGPHSQEDVFSAPPAAGGHRFYFDTYDGSAFASDEEGLPLGDIKAARARAQMALADMLHDAVPDGDHLKLFVRVRDEEGRTVLKAAVMMLVETGGEDETTNGGGLGEPPAPPDRASWGSSPHLPQEVPQEAQIHTGGLTLGDGVRRIVPVSLSSS